MLRYQLFNIIRMKVGQSYEEISCSSCEKKLDFSDGELSDFFFDFFCFFNSVFFL